MPKFVYQAMNDAGSQLKGTVEADSEEAALNQVAARGYIPLRVTMERSIGDNLRWQGLKRLLSPVKSPELILFTKQLRTLLRAGVPLIRLLQVLESQTDNVKLKDVIAAINMDVQEGASLYAAFRKHPKIFSPLYCGMVQAGESSGALPEVLDRLTYILEHEHRIRSDIRAALQYPIVVIVFLCIAFFVLLTFVIPKFVNIFSQAGLKLPLPTRISMGMYQFLDNHMVAIVIVILLMIVALVIALRTEGGKFMRDYINLRLPVLGALLIKGAMARFSSIFGILQASGVSVVESMRILTDTIGNRAISAEFTKIMGRLEEGRGIADPLRRSKYFTPIVTNMVAIGEESGNLEQLLSEIATHYDSELEYAMKKLSEAIGPILTIGLAAMIGFFALSIFLPMWDLMNIVR